MSYGPYVGYHMGLIVGTISKIDTQNYVKAFESVP